MSRCEDNISRFDLYLDGELHGDELKEFNRHVKECGPCRREFEERRRFLETVRAARPMHAPSEKFRADMAALLAVPTVGPGSKPDVPAVTATKAKAPSWLLWLWSTPKPAFIACALAILGVIILWKVSERDAGANAFVDIAVETHRQQLAGHLPLEVRTKSAREISAWFAGRVPFKFRLPSSQETAGQPQEYELTGGRLVNFRGRRTAYIAYRMRAQVISLVVTSASTSVALGGEETTSKGITFHTHRRGELQVVTWSVHNLTYALVSGVNVPARESCAVCHASTKQEI